MSNTKMSLGQIDLFGLLEPFYWQISLSHTQHCGIEIETLSLSHRKKNMDIDIETPLSQTQTQGHNFGHGNWNMY